MGEKLNAIGSEKIMLQDKITNVSIAKLKGKSEISNLQLELEEKLKDVGLKTGFGITKKSYPRKEPG